MANPAVLIVGAGPTGLVLAISLARQKIPIRIIDENEGPGLASRAMAVHARTLELYRQWGFGDEVVAQGVPIEAVHAYARGKEVASLSFKDIGTGLSPYPFVLAYAQDDHEKFLQKKLNALGVQVEWKTKLKSLTEKPSSVQAEIDKVGVSESVEVKYLCGCDGAHSQVRQSLNLGFPGGTYSELFFVADCKVDRPNKDLNVILGSEDFGLMMPVRSSGSQRIIGLVPPDLIDRKDLKLSDFQAHVENLLNIKVLETNWFSAYHTHHRVTEHFRVGRCFLLGDAGHIHSPAGGQGMNTGIGDAINLGWKMGQVLNERASANLLDSFEPERMAFAQMLVKTTDRAFRMVVGRSLVNQTLRLVMIPSLLKTAWSSREVRRFMFKILSQIHIHYRKSPISRGQAIRLQGGDRLPWVSLPNNFDVLKSADWQMHIYGAAESSFAQICEDYRIPLHIFPWNKEAQHNGLERDVAYLIRPDSYIALILPGQDAQPLKEYVEEFKLTTVDKNS